MINLRQHNFSLLRQKYQFYFVYDPIYSNEKICIFVKTRKQILTRNLFENFSDKDYFSSLLNKRFDEMKDKIKFNLYSFLIACVFFFLGTLLTFDFLDFQGLNFLPIILIFCVSFSIIGFSINYIRLQELDKFIDSNEDLDYELLEILIMKSKIENED